MRTGSEVSSKRFASSDAVVPLALVHRDVIVPLANGEPDGFLRAIDSIDEPDAGVRIHQMHALRPRRVIDGLTPGVEHVAYFLSSVTRRAFAERTCDFAPAHFSEMPHILRTVTDDPIVMAAASPPDEHGWFSLGTNADYTATFIGRAPFVLEVNEHMPRTHGENSVHVSQIIGWWQNDQPLVEIAPPDHDPRSDAIGALIAEHVPDGATIQVGIGSIPSAVIRHLSDHRDLGIHTELMSDGIMELFEKGVITGTRKETRPGRMVATFALGSQRLYDFIDGNPALDFVGVNWVNNPRVIGREPMMISINGTLEVDIFGQANSEMIDGHLFSGSGGQADFAHGAMFSPHGKGFLALHSTNSDESVSRVKVRLESGAMVTTLKNATDNVVTEYGIAELHGQPISVRARRLIDIAHPKFRDELEAEARSLGFLRD